MSKQPVNIKVFCEKHHWELCWNSRVERMVKLIDLNAPNIIIASEAELIVKAYLKAHTTWAMLRKIAWRECKKVPHEIWYVLRVWWFQATHGYTEEEAIERVCNIKGDDKENEQA